LKNRVKKTVFFSVMAFVCLANSSFSRGDELKGHVGKQNFVVLDKSDSDKEILIKFGDKEKIIKLDGYSANQITVKDLSGDSNDEVLFVDLSGDSAGGSLRLFVFKGGEFQEVETDKYCNGIDFFNINKKTIVVTEDHDTEDFYVVSGLLEWDGEKLMSVTTPDVWAKVIKRKYLDRLNEPKISNSDQYKSIIYSDLSSTYGYINDKAKAKFYDEQAKAYNDKARKLDPTIPEMN
jgi:hypothetical protein